MKVATDAVDEVSGIADTSLLPPASNGIVPTRTPSPAPYVKAKDHLDIPLLVPSRAPSPGANSTLSTDEWHRLNGSGSKWPSQKPKSWRLKLRAFWIRNLGLFYMLLAQVFGTIMVVTTRYLEVFGNNGKGFHPFQVLFVRMAITTVLASSYMFYKKTPHFPFGLPEIRWLLILRGFAGFFGIFGMYYSLTVLPISDATVLTYLSPGLSLWACSIFIGSTFSRIDMLGTLVSLVGVIFIAKPASLISFSSAADSIPQPHSPDAAVGAGTNSTSSHSHGWEAPEVAPRERVIAVGVAMVGVLGSAIVYTVLRAIGKRAHPLISVNYFGVWCTLVSFVMQLALPSVGFLLPANWKEWVLLLLLGVCGFIMQFLLVIGLSYEKGSRATNMTYTSMLFALASDKIVFGITPSISSIMGSTLILTAAIVMALQKAQPASEQKEQQEGETDEERGFMQHFEQEAGEDEMGIEDMQLRTLR